MTAPADLDSFLRHADAVRTLARRLVLDDDQADDVMQDAYLAVMRRPPPSGVPMWAWLRGVVRNLAARRRRDERRRARREHAQSPPGESPPPDEIAQRAEAHRALVKAVLDLDEPYRTTLLMRYFEGLSPKEVAARFGVPVATVNTRVHRGIARLRTRLDEAHGGRRLPWFLAVMPLATRGSPRALAPSAATAAGALIVSAKSIAFGVATLVVAAAFFFAAIGPEGGPMERPKARAPGTFEGPRLSGREPDRSALLTPATPAGDPEGALPPIDPRRDLHGVVTDEAGTPIVGARIVTFTSGWARYGIYVDGTAPREHPGPSAASAGDGTFRIRLPRDASVHVRVSAPGYAVMERFNCPAGERLEIALPRAVRARVRVTDPEGAPVPGASLRLARTPLADDGLADRRGTTDAAGEYVFSDLPPSTWALLTVEHARLAPSRWRRVDLPTAGEVVVGITLLPGRTLTGRVVDADSGSPIPGAGVGLGWTMVKRVPADGEGRYTLEGYTGEFYVDVYARAPGYASESRRGPFDGAVDFLLRRGATVRGRVVTQDGTPVADTAVAAACENRVDSVQTIAGPDGRFRLEGVRRASSHVLALLATGHGRTLLDLDVPDEDALDLGDVVIASRQSLLGRVLRADGSPAAHVAVELEGANADRGRLRPGQAAFTTRRGDLETHRTDHLGQFRFGDVAPGTYKVTAKPVGQRWISSSVTIPEDGAPDEVPLQLLDGRLLRVRVVDDGGSPVAYAHVSARAHDEYGITCMTDGDGWAQFRTEKPVASIEVTLSFAEQDYLAPAIRKVTEDEYEIQVVVQRAYVARGRVLDPAGKPVPQVFLGVYQDGVPLTQLSTFTENQITTDLEGKFKVLLPESARVDLVVVPMAYRGGDVLGGQLEDIGAGTGDHVLRLRPLVYDRSQAVRVWTPEGKPAVDVHVYARIYGRDIDGANVRTDAEGKATLTGLPREPVVLHARALPGTAEANRWTELTEYPVRAGADVVELRFENAVFIDGRVLDPGGVAVPGAFVAIYNLRTAVATETTGDEGRFRLRVSPRQAFPLQLTVTLGQRWTTVEKVARDRRDSLEVVLP